MLPQYAVITNFYILIFMFQAFSNKVNRTATASFLLSRKHKFTNVYTFLAQI